MPISVNDRLRVEKLNLSRLQRERTSVIGRWELQLKEAQDKRHTPARIEELEKKLQTAKSIFERAISRAEDRIAELDTELITREQEKQLQARAGLETLMKKARDVWLSNGGTSSGFDEAWPQMEVEVLSRKTLDSPSVLSARKPL